MTDRRQKPLGQLALVLVFVALALTVGLSGYVMVMRWREMPEVTPVDDPTRLDPMQKLRLMLALLLFAVLAILAFVIGAYLVIRLGRSLMSARVGDQRTEFVDAWAASRVTDAELEAVDHMFDEEPERDKPGPSGDNRGSTDEDDRPSQDESDPP